MSTAPRSPIPPFTLRPWPSAVFLAWDERADRASTITTRAGTGRNFAALLAEARTLLLAGDLPAIESRLPDRRFARAVVTAWSNDPTVARQTMTPEVVRSVTVRARPSRLTTIVAATLFLTHFDRLDEWHPQLFDLVRELVRVAVYSQPTRQRTDVVETLRAHQAILLERDGPRHLASHMLDHGFDVVAWFRAAYLSGYLDTRFGRITRDAYYLAKIDRADAERGDHSFLDAITNEVLKRQKTETTEQDQLYFGHQVLTALTAKATRHPSAAWLGAALEIGGDPRFEQTATWRTWWARVPEENRRRAVRWMSGVNLRTFLEAVETYAEDTFNSDMERMLARRKRLLLGLYEQDRVEDVRLILGDSIRIWMSKRYGATVLDAARLEGGNRQDTAVVYVDCGDFSIVEGSHNFKIHVYVGGAVDALANRAARSFDATFLREVLPDRHRRSVGPATHAAFPHLGFEWLRKTLDFLRFHDIAVDEHSLMTPYDYADLMGRRAHEGQWRWD